MMASPIEKGPELTKTPSPAQNRIGKTDKQRYSSAPASQEPAVEQLEDYEASGAEFIRLNGKVPRKGWRTKSAMAPVEAMKQLEAGGNVGIRLRPTDLVIDVDPRNFPKGDNPIGRLAKDLNLDLGAYPHVITGSGGSHYYTRLPEPMPVRNDLPEYPGVEFKSHGRQVVAAGSVHPETGELYLWDEDPLAAPLGEAAPLATEALVELIRRPEVKSEGAEGGEVEPEQLEVMLEALAPEDYRDNKTWLELMMACHHATAGSGREQFLAWSLSDPMFSNHEATIKARWNSLRSDTSRRQVTKGTLFKALSGAGRSDLIPRPTAEDDFAEDLVDDQFEAPAGEKNSLLDRINADRFTTMFGGKYMVGREYHDRFLDRHRIEWFPDDAMRKHMNLRSIETEQGKALGQGDWWLKHPQRRQYDRVIFDPSADAATRPNEYNLWRGWSVQPAEGDWSHMQRVIRDVLCGGNEAFYHYVLKWSAYMVQHPERQAEVALVFRGEKGTGKGTFGRAMCQLAGQHGQHVTQQEHFTGRFNEHLNETVCLFVDEVQWRNDKQAEGALKGLITEPTLVFEGKFKPIYEGRNMLHVIIASNEDWVVPATADERRFAVFETDAEANRTLPVDFYHALQKQMAEGGKAAMLHDLLSMDLSDWHPRSEIPQTDALTQQKVQGFSQDPLLFWWHRSLDNGQVYNASAIMLSKDEWPKTFEIEAGPPKDEIVDAVNQTAKELGSRRTYTKASIAKFLYRMGGRDVRVGSQRAWEIPELNEAREAFEDHIGGKLVWDD